MINCCQSLNGLEQIDADVVIVDNINVETEFASLQTQIDNLNVAVSNGGGYFVLTCEFNGNSTNSGFFGFGSGINSSGLRVALPNCSCIGYRAQCTTAVATGGNIVFLRNGTAVNALGIAYITGDTLVENYTRNTPFVLGDTFAVRFNAAGGSMGGTLWRVNYIFQTNAVNGQNVSFLAPTFVSLQPNQTAYLTDTITTNDNTQTHQLEFGIPRGKSTTGSLGSVSNGTAAVSTTITTDANGNDNIAFNFVLQKGDKGDRGDKGDTGADGNADPVVLVVAAAAGAAAGGAAGGTAGGIAGAASGSSAGASSGSSAATNIFNSLVDPRLQNVENKTYNIISPINVLDLKTIIGGTSIELYPTGTLYLGGQVFGSGNTTDNINMLCNGGLIVNSGSSQFVNLVEMLNDLNIAGDLDVEGQVNITENLTCLSDINLNTFLIFNNGTAYDTITFQSFPAISPTGNNQGRLELTSNIFTMYAKNEMYNNQQIAQYPYLTFKTDAGFSGFDYGNIICDTTSAPAVNNGGNFIFNCNKLTTSNDLTITGDLEVLGNFNIEDITIANLTIPNTLKVSLIKPLDDNIVIEMGNATSEINLLGASILLGVDTETNVVGLSADSLSLGENSSCGIIDIGNDTITETTIRGYNLGVNAEIINIGQAGTSTFVSLRGEEIDIGDTDTNLIKIGRYNDFVSPIVVKMGNDTGETEIYGNPIKLTGQDITIGDPTTTGDTLDIVSQTINIGQTPPNTATTNIDTRHINIGINGSGAYPVDITIGSDTSTTDIYGDIITIGDPNSQNSTQVLSDICNILTNGTSIRTNALDMGSNYTTTANLTGQSITILGTNTTTLRGDTINIGNDSSTDTIQIGNPVSYTEIEGSQINMGVGSVLNTINIGNAFSVVNIQGNTNNPINVANMFFNQIGF
jgi:hypothetical protein